MNDYFSYTLHNGLRIIHKPHTGNVSYAGFIVKAGTRDESEREHGMAHFIEHMLFKGTLKRSSRSIINRIEGVGGELNAYTNKEETVLYSIFLEKDFKRSFELMADMFFYSQFPQKEIEKEIDVIIDEIHSYEDSPSELIFDEFENYLFENTSLGHNILGTEDSIVSFDTKTSKLFFEKFYIPQNTVFFSLGKTPFDRIIKLAEETLSDIKSTETENKRLVISRNFDETFSHKINKDTSQVHVILGGQSYDFYNEKRTALYLFNNILGGPCMNSRLNIALREKNGYVYNVESNMTSYSDTGVYSIYFGTDHKYLDKCINDVFKEITNLQKNKLSTQQLHNAKKQLIGQMALSRDNNENVALALGKSFLCYNHYESFDEIFKKIDRLKSEDLLESANYILNRDRISTLIYI